MNSGDKTVVDIDGNTLEGGGQILRNATAFSALLGIPIRVTNIRGGREKPGLRPQHLSGLELARDLCQGFLEGGFVGSTEILFKPGTLVGGHFDIDTKTAGKSLCLPPNISSGLPLAMTLGHLQSVISGLQLARTNDPLMLLSCKSCDLTLRGGTNAEKAPQIDYFIRVFQPMISKFGIKFGVELVRRGLFPRGGGQVILKVNPMKSLNAVQILDRGHIVDVTGISWLAGSLPPRIARTCADTAKAVLRSDNAKYVSLKESVPKVDIETQIETERTAVGNGTGIVVVGQTSTGCLFGGDCLGRKGLSAEQVGRSAAEMLLDNLSHGGCVDDYLQDQVIIFMALADGKSRIRIGPLTLHTKTAIFVAELLTKVKFTTEECGDGSLIIECNGIGFKNENI